MELQHLTDAELDVVTGGGRFSSFLNINDSFNLQQNISVQTAVNVQAGNFNVPFLNQAISQGTGQIINIG
jgi:hypothetical protein